MNGGGIFYWTSQEERQTNEQGCTLRRLEGFSPFPRPVYNKYLYNKMWLFILYYIYFILYNVLSGVYNINYTPRVVVLMFRVM